MVVTLNCGSIWNSILMWLWFRLTYSCFSLRSFCTAWANSSILVIVVVLTFISWFTSNDFEARFCQSARRFICFSSASSISAPIASANCFIYSSIRSFGRLPIFSSAILKLFKRACCMAGDMSTPEKAVWMPAMNSLTSLSSSDCFTPCWYAAFFAPVYAEAIWLLRFGVYSISSKSSSPRRYSSLFSISFMSMSL